MKKIQKSIMMLAALLMAGTAFTSCSNEESVAEQNTKGDKYVLVVKAKKGNDAVTRALAYNGESGAIDATWTVGDVVYVFNTTTYEQIGTLTAQETGATATLSGTFDDGAGVAEGDQIRLLYPKNAISYAGQVGTLDDIATNYDFAEATVEVTEIDNVNKKIIAEDAEFVNNQSIAKFTLTDVAGDPIEADELTVGLTNEDNMLFIETVDPPTPPVCGSIYIQPAERSSVIWAALATPFESVTASLFLSASVGSDYYYFVKPNASLVNGKFYDMTVSMMKQGTIQEAFLADNEIILSFMGGDLTLTSTYNGSAFSDVTPGGTADAQALLVSSSMEKDGKNLKVTVSVDLSSLMMGIKTGYMLIDTANNTYTWSNAAVGRLITLSKIEINGSEILPLPTAGT